MRAYEIHAPGRALKFGTVEADAKRAAREADGIVKPVDIDTRKHELIDFLNSLSAAQYARDRTGETQLASDLDRAIETFVGDPADTDFQKGYLEALKTTRRELGPKVAGKCDACGRSAEGTLKLATGNDVDAIEAWAETIEVDNLWALQKAAEIIRDRARALGAEWAGRSVQ